MSWIKDGINIHEFIVPFHGTYRRKRYQHSFPPDAIFPNNKSCVDPCQSHLHQDQKEDRHGCHDRAWEGRGRPATLNSHDQQYLNCFMKHYPFKLDQVVNLPQYLKKESYHTKLHDKSDCDHFLLSNKLIIIIN